MKEYINKDLDLSKKDKLSILFYLIVISGIFGFIYEFIFYYFNGGMKYFYYRGGNFLPWINIYAIGALLIVLFTYKFRRNPLKVFLIGSISSGILEYIGGYLVFKIGNGFRCWDYNNEIFNFLNIDGFVCLRSVLFFGLSGLFLIYGILPFLIYLNKKINKNVFFYVSIILVSIFLFDEVYNLIIARIFSLPRASDIYKSIGFKYVSFK